MLPDACVKTSGARGLHVYAGTSLDSFDETRRFARTAAERLAEDRPDLATTLSSHGARRGRVLIDWKQNDPHRSTIAAYSLRGLTVPLVSTPITWDEVKRMRDGSRMRFGPREVLDRLDRLGDLFRHFAF
jgi:bifunctional non-homologous end joining protein LigD